MFMPSLFPKTLLAATGTLLYQYFLSVPHSHSPFAFCTWIWQRLSLCDGYENHLGDIHWSLESCQVPILHGALSRPGRRRYSGSFFRHFLNEEPESHCVIQGFSHWASNGQENKPLSLLRMRKTKTFLGPLSVSRNFPPDVMHWHWEQLK